MKKLATLIATTAFAFSVAPCIAQDKAAQREDRVTRSEESRKSERKTKPKQAIVWPAADIKWDEDPLVKGGKMALLWGNPAKSAYGALARWPGGADAYQPLHSHPYDTKLVILSGTLVVSLEGKPAQELGPRSYWFLPGGMNHSTACKAGEDCVFFITMSGRDTTKWADKK